MELIRTIVGAISALQKSDRTSEGLARADYVG